MKLCQIDISQHDPYYHQIMSFIEEYSIRRTDIINDKIRKDDDSLIFAEVMGDGYALDNEKLKKNGYFLSGKEMTSRQAKGYMFASGMYSSDSYTFLYGIIDYTRNKLIYCDMSERCNRDGHLECFLPLAKDGRRIPSYILKGLDLTLYEYVKKCSRPDVDFMNELRKGRIVANQDIDFANEFDTDTNYITLSDICAGLYREFDYIFSSQNTNNVLKKLWSAKIYDSKAMNFRNRISKLASMDSSNLRKCLKYLYTESSDMSLEELENRYDQYTCHDVGLSAFRKCRSHSLIRLGFHIPDIAKIKKVCDKDVLDEIISDFRERKISKNEFFNIYCKTPYFKDISSYFSEYGSDIEKYRYHKELKDCDLMTLAGTICYLNSENEDKKKRNDEMIKKKIHEKEMMEKYQIINGNQFIMNYQNTIMRYHNGYPVGMNPRFDEFKPKER